MEVFSVGEWAGLADSTAANFCIAVKSSYLICCDLRDGDPNLLSQLYPRFHPSAGRLRSFLAHTKHVKLVLLTAVGGVGVLRHCHGLSSGSISPDKKRSEYVKMSCS